MDLFGHLRLSSPGCAEATPTKIAPSGEERVANTLSTGGRITPVAIDGRVPTPARPSPAAEAAKRETRCSSTSSANDGCLLGTRKSHRIPDLGASDLAVFDDGSKRVMEMDSPVTRLARPTFALAGLA